MIESVNEATQSVAVNNNVLFVNDVVRTRSASCCGWLNYSTGSGLFQLTKPGIYEILFNANVSSDTVGALALALKANGEQLSGTEMDTTPSAANVFSNVSANRLVPVCGNGSTTISVANVGTLTTIIKNANIIIKKIA